MKTIEEKEVKKILKEIGLTQFSVQFFLDSVKICEKNKIHILDLNLTKDIYPALSKKYNRTEKSIEKEIYCDLKDTWAKNHEKICKKLKYENKPTIKKLIRILLLLIRTK